jgi:hypothetical protein
LLFPTISANRVVMSLIEGLTFYRCAASCTAIHFIPGGTRRISDGSQVRTGC